MGEVTYNAEAIHEKFHDLAELRAFARKQIAHWDRIRQESFEMKAEYVEGGGPMIWSYTNHVVELMRTVLDLSAQNRMIIAVPLIRLVVENAMTSIWLYLEPSNARAVIHEGFRLRKAAVENIIETGSDSVDKSQVDEIKQVLDEFADSDLPGGRHFEQRCRQIFDGLPVYCSWRVMSSFSHAGMAMGDFYLAETETAPGLAFRPDAELESHEAWLGTAVCMLLASLKACNEIDGKGSLRAQVERAAKKMGITLNFAAA
ncbi:hypothetical protein AHiyo8_00570 [Arthrobacter sp. Hiyo8]|uniref:hypothetical protein n=1 Tax=Arthrobacter sp. Hiyo1 TaxID=1588020 RepID=UPI00068384A7|nr:hypothetical protein [Arthrobacter sp. Hiyo1]BAS11754.1 hypothetical protein AHiyo8_00570 [Arthrobacter sp. Hiyo8]GAP61258.1 hypothetical protein AHiyo1_49410 [Arthrobacter sp. Hiyo1]